MAVRRRPAARFAAVCALVGGLVALDVSPAFAEEDTVRVNAAGRFTAGASAEGVRVEVRKRTEGCVLLRTALALRLDGLQADQVRVQVNSGGRWLSVPVSGGGGGVNTEATSPTDPRLCEGKSKTVRYRVAFAANTPDGRLAVVGEATNAVGRVLGLGSDTSRMVGGLASASPTPSQSPTPSPSLTPTATVTDAVAGDETPVEALADPAGGAIDPVTTRESGVSPIMFFGLAMVAVGIVLIVLLVRRFREDKDGRNGSTDPNLAGQGVGSAPGQPGPGYGQPVGRPLAAPGHYGSPPAQRPAAGLYGVPADATQALPGALAAVDRPGVPSPAAPPGPGRYGTPVPGPSGPPRAPAGEDDRTRYLPRMRD
ncbi:hypothetical protein QTQ03_24535 [Micromonospora sp. WMMA1363]|uniref:hypothetical protein n=1 Tax=Micromonospora sp. WMMA1363 TaxID=3053985 RepID=UPI00259CE598|nr:hypothetical protein [Micromonospora sp. WMMA1363]MDM4722606.1 hypothetical protein [Micromonospora sp. WMMA1363]